MSKLQTALVYMTAGAIIAVGLMIILRPAPSLSQNDQMVTSTLNAILSKLGRMDNKLDTINSRLGQVGSEVSRIYTRTGTSQERSRHDYWTR